jgi:hypothetical protein
MNGNSTEGSRFGSRTRFDGGERRQGVTSKEWEDHAEDIGDDDLHRCIADLAAVEKERDEALGLFEGAIEREREAMRAKKCKHEWHSHPGQNYGVCVICGVTEPKESKK